MQVKNNYQDCLTNVACSIRKYFNLAYHHDTNSFLDQLLEKRKPSHVVMILFDGMGSRILERSLDKDSFFLNTFRFFLYITILIKKQTRLQYK